MITFDIIPTIISHTSKTRILNLWNLTASPSGCSIATQSLEGGGEKWSEFSCFEGDAPVMKDYHETITR